MSHSQVQIVNQRQLAVLPAGFSRSLTESVVHTKLPGANALQLSEDKPFLVYDNSFQKCLGPNPSLKQIADVNWPAFHEAGVYIPSLRSVFVTSNRMTDSGNEQRIEIHQIILEQDGSRQIKHVPADQHGILMGNGGTNYQGGVLFCSQGDEEVPSALVHLDCSTFKTTTILNNFAGRQFNSVNDVVEYKPTGEIFFTDPSYGFHQGFRPAMQLPCQSYAFDPKTGNVRVVADDQGMPNGIVFSHDWNTCYITDTAVFDGAGGVFPNRPGCIYAYDVKHYEDKIDLPVYLTNKRVFAFADTGCPDGIKIDTEGNVYSGCGDGVHVWNKHGVLIGKIVLPHGDGCANLVFGPNQTLFILAEKRVYEAQIAADGALSWD